MCSVQGRIGASSQPALRQQPHSFKLQAFETHSRIIVISLSSMECQQRAGVPSWHRWQAAERMVSLCFSIARIGTESFRAVIGP